MIVFTGAFDVGKTTVLRRLGERLGFMPVEEAHRQVLRELGERREGHPSNAPFARIADPEHFCPMCQPVAFSERVFTRQREIEAGGPGFVDRGQIDPLELRSRRTGEPLDVLLAELSLPYAQAFVFEIVDEIVEERWGKSRAERRAEAHAIQCRLSDAYRAKGIPVTHVPPGTVEVRERFVRERMSP